MHQMERLIDILNAHFVRDERIDLDAAIHIHIDDGGHICAASGPAKGYAFPASSCDELEGAGGDFFACARNADDVALAPAFMTAL